MIEEHQMAGYVVQFERRRNSSRFEVIAEIPMRRRLLKPWRRTERVATGRIEYEGHDIRLIPGPQSISLSDNLQRCIILRWKTMQRNLVHEEIERLETRRRAGAQKARSV